MVIFGISYTNIKTNNQTKRALTLILYVWPWDSLPPHLPKSSSSPFSSISVLSFGRPAMAAAKRDGGYRRPFSLLFLHLIKIHLLHFLSLASSLLCFFFVCGGQRWTAAVLRWVLLFCFGSSNYLTLQLHFHHSSFPFDFLFGLQVWVAVFRWCPAMANSGGDFRHFSSFPNLTNFPILFQLHFPAFSGVSWWW